MAAGAVVMSEAGLAKLGLEFMDGEREGDW